MFNKVIAMGENGEMGRLRHRGKTMQRPREKIAICKPKRTSV